VSRGIASAEPAAAGERLLRQQAALAELTAHLFGAESGDGQAGLAHLLATAGDALAVDRASVWWFRDQGTRLECMEFWDRTPQAPCGPRSVDVARANRYVDALLASEAVAIGDTAADARAEELLDSYYRPLGVAAALEVPIVVRGRPDGVLCYEQRGAARDWTPGDQLFGVAVAHLVALLAEGGERREAEEAVRALSADLERRVAERTEELERANQALRESERRLREVIDLVPHYIFAKDQQGQFLIVNRAVAELNGTTVERMLAGTVESIAHSPEDAQRYLAEDREVIRSGRPTVIPEEVMTDWEGHPHLVQTTKIPFTFSGSGAAAVLGVSIDITERKRAEAERDHLEQQLRRAQKMEAIGTLAGGIAHDFNNILTSILGFSDLLGKRLQHDQDAMRDIEQITQGGRRAAELVRQILTFSRQQRQSRSVIPLQSTIEEALRLLRAAIPTSVEFVVTIDPSAPPVLADATQIHQVMMNLGANAAAAVESSLHARLEIDYERCEIDRAFASSHPGLKPGPHVCLRVRDNGHGMDAATLERAFEPFFTTKDPTRGTGLGLAVVHGIVRDHDGTVTVESAPGVGTTFRIFLPAHAAPELVLPAERAGLRRGAGERVLCIDDESANAQLLERILRSLGYAVRSFTSPQAALTAFRAAPESFDLVITDLTMPLMSGVELGIEVMATRAEMPVLLITGFSGSITEEHAHEVGMRGLLFKPFSLESLGHAVARCLEARPRAAPAEEVG
jgi:PAS domain S-box-containing protein